MVMLSLPLDRQVRRLLEHGQVDAAAHACELALEAGARSAFDAVLSQRFPWSAAAASVWLEQYHGKSRDPASVKALYCELNALEINPENWHVDAFVQHHGDTPDMLYSPSSPSIRPFPLPGGAVQALFRDYLDQPDSPSRRTAPQAAHEAAVLLVAMRVFQLFRDAQAHGRSQGRAHADMPLVMGFHDTSLMLRLP